MSDWIMKEVPRVSKKKQPTKNSHNVEKQIAHLNKMKQFWDKFNSPTFQDRDRFQRLIISEK